MTYEEDGTDIETDPNKGSEVYDLTLVRLEDGELKVEECSEEGDGVVTAGDLQGPGYDVIVQREDGNEVIGDVVDVIGGERYGIEMPSIGGIYEDLEGSEDVTPGAFNAYTEGEIGEEDFFEYMTDIAGLQTEEAEELLEGIHEKAMKYQDEIEENL
ncbi:MAG: hypothetical protein ACLFS3_02420 [Candidatus Aenigmatarchaeota archaeon]